MTLLFHDPIFQEHKTGSHPESAKRLVAIDRRLSEAGMLEKLPCGKVREASREQITAIHDDDYRRHLRETAAAGGGHIETDTVISPRSYDVAITAAGTACAAVDQVLSGNHQTALCLIRPPGHHALPQDAMGFCLFNNVAVAARQAINQHKLDRVMIVDWDVHHGNGTQHMFYEDEQVTFFSSHRWPFYPGSGRKEETGRGKGLGTTFNLPLEFGTSRKEFLSAFEQRLHQAAEKSRPELVLISAGFDAHRLDPVGSLGLETEDFKDLTHIVQDVASTHCEGRLVSLLEGGYHTDALADSVLLHLETLIEGEKNEGEKTS
ncbi:Histone deacetylase-like amidohydrolase [Polystyrenella longa]|uniref:Histone deacetylase-like amidohydrolase n=1 Tax=Polystyrenella longa TaxID=2528007 RepID=A0A518CPL7_9PLAN|nr:histone deacetylase [Polystyrenella longa]QDU81165.1 Histone deacetylase-like amidohydrolase [Polystyrenella longa]